MLSTNEQMKRALGQKKSSSIWERMKEWLSRFFTTHQ